MYKSAFMHMCMSLDKKFLEMKLLKRIHAFLILINMIKWPSTVCSNVGQFNRWKNDFTLKRLIQLTHGVKIYNLDNLTLGQCSFSPLSYGEKLGKGFSVSSRKWQHIADTYFIWPEKYSVKGRGVWSINGHRCKRIAKIRENRKRGKIKVTAEITQELWAADIRRKESVARRCNAGHPKMELWLDSTTVVSSLSSVLQNPYSYSHSYIFTGFAFETFITDYLPYTLARISKDHVTLGFFFFFFNVFFFNISGLLYLTLWN